MTGKLARPRQLSLTRGYNLRMSIYKALATLLLCSAAQARRPRIEAPALQITLSLQTQIVAPGRLPRLAAEVKNTGNVDLDINPFDTVLEEDWATNDFEIDGSQADGALDKPRFRGTYVGMPREDTGPILMLRKYRSYTTEILKLFLQVALLCTCQVAHLVPSPLRSTIGTTSNRLAQANTPSRCLLPLPSSPPASEPSSGGFKLRSIRCPSTSTLQVPPLYTSSTGNTGDSITTTIGTRGRV